VKVRKMLIILNIRKNTTFLIYMNDHIVSVRIFDSMFEFLHQQYFSQIIFKLMYLFEHKTVIISDNLNLLEFQETSEELRLSLKYREKIINWFNLINWVKLDAFLWLILFLRIFISERAKYVLKLKEVYLIEISVEFKSKKSHDNEIKKCDKNLIKKRSTTRSKKLTIQRKWVKKNLFNWNFS